LDSYQPACNSKVIHIGLVDKSSFNLFLILGNYRANRKNTKTLSRIIRFSILRLSTDLPGNKAQSPEKISQLLFLNIVTFNGTTAPVTDAGGI